MSALHRIKILKWLIALSCLTSAAHAGSISGAVSYPSDFIPLDMTVCAELIEGRTLKCVKSTRKYKLDLPPGDYYIYAKTSDDKSYKAYYTEGVLCGKGHGGIAGCNSHKRIVIKVSADSITKNANPQDWYDR